MTPPLSGTLKSTRTKTRLPFRSRSQIESFMVARLVPVPDDPRKPSRYMPSRRAARREPRPALEAFLHERAQQVDAAARVAPLVVVPRQDLDEVAVHHLRVRHVDDRRVRVAPEV